MSIDFTKMSVDQLRKKLIEFGYTEEEVENIKGKSNLTDAVISEMESMGLIPRDESANFGEVEYDDAQTLQTGQEVNDNEEAVVSPKIGSPGWQEYVLSHLESDEYSEDKNNGRKYPKSIGLRRIAQLLLGPITQSGPVQVWPALNSDGQATVLYQVTIMWTHGMNLQWLSEDRLADLNIPVRVFSEIADANTKNTPSPFSLHLSATASSRAEGRAFRKALQINVVTAEEMSAATQEDKDTISLDAANFDKEPITKSQRATIETLSERLGIDLEKALDFHLQCKDVSTLTRSQAAQFLGNLNRYQTNTEQSSQIPEIIKINFIPAVLN